MSEIQTVSAAPFRAAVRANPLTTCLAACAVYIAIAAILWPHVYFSLVFDYSYSILAYAAAVVVALLLLGVVAQPRAPTSWAISVFGARWKPALANLIAFWWGLAAFSTYKHAPVPFFADKFLADADELLWFGQPWRWAHAVFPDTVSPVLLAIYDPVWLIQWTSAGLLAPFVADRRLRSRYLVGLATVLLALGTIGRVLGCSAGPIFYDRMFGGHRYSDLIFALASNHSSSLMLAESNYLYAAYISVSAVFGNGISAMPSMHVAITVLNALFLSALYRPLRWIAWPFAGAIMFGAVYYGWHYSLDVFVSLVATVYFWKIAGRIADQTPKFNG